MAIPGAGCASYANVRFAPAIQDAELRDGQELHARIVVAWRGVHERDDVYDWRFRIRVENPRAEPFALAPAEFELVDGALAPFGAVRVENMPAAVEGGSQATFDLAFPVPDGKKPDDLDLSVLSLRMRLEGGRWNWSTTLQREERYYPYYDPYWDYPWGFHLGVVFCHH